MPERISPPRRYPTRVRDVRELCLSGPADPRPWEELLAGAGLLPALDEEGRAQVLLVACSARYLGTPFRELSLSVRVAPPEGGLPEGLFLAAALNSVPFFAWVERTAFRTPYRHGRIRVDVEERPALLASAPDVDLAGAMGVHPLDATLGERMRERGTAPALWEGPVYLPGRRPRARRRPYFFARLSGPIETYAFDAAEDDWSVRCQDPGSPWTRLAAPYFSPRTWTIRRRAEHSKGRTRTVRSRTPSHVPG